MTRPASHRNAAERNVPLRGPCQAWRQRRDGTNKTKPKRIFYFFSLINTQLSSSFSGGRKDHGNFALVIFIRNSIMHVLNFLEFFQNSSRIITAIFIRQLAACYYFVFCHVIDVCYCIWLSGNSKEVGEGAAEPVVLMEEYYCKR